MSSLEDKLKLISSILEHEVIIEIDGCFSEPKSILNEMRFFREKLLCGKDFCSLEAR